MICARRNPPATVARRRRPSRAFIRARPQRRLPCLSADEVCGVVDAAAAAVARLLWIRTEGPRPPRPWGSSGRSSDDAVGRDAALNPIDDGPEGVKFAGRRAEKAVPQAGHGEQLDELTRLIAGRSVDRVVPGDRVVDREYAVAGALIDDQLAAVRAEGRAVGRAGSREPHRRLGERRNRGRFGASALKS